MILTLGLFSPSFPLSFSDERYERYGVTRLARDLWGLLLFLADIPLSYFEEDPGLDHNATTIV